MIFLTFAQKLTSLHSVFMFSNYSRDGDKKTASLYMGVHGMQNRATVLFGSNPCFSDALLKLSLPLSFRFHEDVCNRLLQSISKVAYARS